MAIEHVLGETSTQKGGHVVLIARVSTRFAADGQTHELERPHRA